MRNFREKGVWAYPTTTGFSCTFRSLDRNKSPLKFLENVAMAVVRETRTFSGHWYIGHIVRSSLW